MARRSTPRSRDWGYDRGGPVDRILIERFLAGHASDIAGSVLEVQEDDYTRRFGAGSVTRSDVLDIAEENVAATIIADLRACANIDSDRYDCVILTQTLHVIPQMDRVLAECHRILRPGGVLLATVPAVSRSCLEYGRNGDFWRMTPAGARALFEPVFGNGVTVRAFGNVGASMAFIHGLGPSEVAVEDLDEVDSHNPTLVGIRAVKATSHGTAPAIGTARADSGLVLLYHRVGGRDADPHGINIRADDFGAQVAWLARECAVMPLVELVEGAHRRALPARAVAVTFDDGYLDTLTTAAPILQSLRLPASCFVVTAGLDAAHVFWWDRLAAALLGSGDRPSELTLSLPGGCRPLPTATRGERLLTHALVYHAMVGMRAAERDRMLGEVSAWAGAEETPSDDCRRLTAAQIRELHLAGIHIGAHTVTHPRLPDLTAGEQTTEIRSSREMLERIVGRPVETFAYPFGTFDASSVTAAEAAGVRYALTCEARAVRAPERLTVPRVDPRTARLDRFAAIIDGMLSETR